jgi:two-component system, sensor histidine kinase and response regulator
MPEKALILIVDDNPANRKMLDILLKKDGYETQTLEDGNNILEVVNTIKPQLILLDIMMPGMDGYQVCEELKESKKTRDIPVIFLTAKSESEALVKGFQVGASDYVTKPFKPVELLARVKTHLQLRQSFEDLKESQKRITELETRNSILAMAGTANHEINQPLTVISGNLYLLEQFLVKKKVSSDQQKYIKEINRGVERIKEILERYRNAVELRYQDYAGSSKIVIFEKNKTKK